MQVLKWVLHCLAQRILDGTISILMLLHLYLQSFLLSIAETLHCVLWSPYSPPHLQPDQHLLLIIQSCLMHIWVRPCSLAFAPGSQLVCPLVLGLLFALSLLSSFNCPLTQAFTHWGLLILSTIIYPTFLFLWLMTWWKTFLIVTVFLGHLSADSL